MRLTPQPVIQLRLSHVGNPVEGDDFSLLSDLEHARALTFARPDLRLRYQRIRAQVRRVLAEFSGVPASALTFGQSSQGKPFLTNLPISFNISHSGDYLAIAIAQQHELGVDLEQMVVKRSRDAIAQRYFHPHEVAFLQTLEPAQRELAFYRLWTLKEAFLKARGTGIAAGLERAVFVFDDLQIHSQFAPELHENPNEWRFWQWQLGGQFALALACRAPDVSLLTVELHCDPASQERLGDLQPVGGT
jgi:4'-phosphopantetheinyl transferase